MSFPPLPLALGRFKQLAQRSNDVWEGGFVQMPMWIDSPDPTLPPWRPTGAVWVSLRTGLIHVAVPDEGEEATADFALQALLEFGLKWAKELTGRPSHVRVKDAALREALAPALARLDTTTEIAAELPYVRDALRSLEESANDTVRVPGLIESPGVTLAHVRAFAVAAARFYEAKPWRHLANDDLIVVATKGAPRGMRHMCVLGRGGQEFGVGFYPSEKAFSKVLLAADRGDYRPDHLVGVTFGPVHDLPFADVDLWEEQHLSVAGPDAYPLAGDFHADGRHLRPDLACLVHMEAVLQALADTTEDELDSGQWERTVETSDGPRTMTLSLPDLLEAEEQRRAGLAARDAEQGGGRAASEGGDDAVGPGTPLDRAQDVVDDAYDAAGRHQMKLARQALALSADCADAWVILGDNAATIEEALERYEQGVAAGRRAIGDGAFDALAGQFWQHVETRPYMRAVSCLAATLFSMGRKAEALDLYRSLVTLNPRDNQGARYVLVPALLEVGLDAEAERWLDAYHEDVSPTWAYARALWTFRARGESPEATELLRHAMGAHPLVTDYLLDPDGMPMLVSDSFAVGSPDEAAAAAEEIREVFATTPEAMAWLARTWAGAAFRASGKGRVRRGTAKRTGRARATTRRRQ
jgi:tetratricopeptide (TPR) repeat protein